MLQTDCTFSKGFPRAPFLRLRRPRLVDPFYHEQNGDCTPCKADEDPDQKPEPSRASGSNLDMTFTIPTTTLRRLRMTSLSRVQRGRTPKPPRLLLYGVEGVGKSTFGSQAPKPIFVQTVAPRDPGRFALLDEYLKDHPCPS